MVMGKKKIRFCKTCGKRIYSFQARVYCDVCLGPKVKLNGVTKKRSLRREKVV